MGLVLSLSDLRRSDIQAHKHSKKKEITNRGLSGSLGLLRVSQQLATHSTDLDLLRSERYLFPCRVRWAKGVSEIPRPSHFVVVPSLSSDRACCT